MLLLHVCLRCKYCQRPLGKLLGITLPKKVLKVSHVNFGLTEHATHFI